MKDDKVSKSTERSPGSEAADRNSLAPSDALAEETTHIERKESAEAGSDQNAENGKNPQEGSRALIIKDKEKTGGTEILPEEDPAGQENEAQENPEQKTGETETEASGNREQKAEEAEDSEDPDQEAEEAETQASDNQEPADRMVTVKVNRKVSVELPEALKDVKLELPRKTPDWKQLFKKPLFYVFLIGAAGLVWFVVNQIRIGLLPAGDLGLWFGIGAVIMAVAWMLLLRVKNPGLRLIGGLLSLLVFASAYLNAQAMDPISDCLHEIAFHAEKIEQTPGIYVSKQVPMKDLSSLKNATVGLIKDRNPELTTWTLQQLEEQGIKVKTKEFTSLQALIRGLKGQAVRAVILTKGDLAAAKEFEDLVPSLQDLTLVKQFPRDTGISQVQLSSDLYEQPFTVLVAASDRDLSQQEFVSDAISVISVNPKTRQILNIQIPRSLQVATACPEGIACPAGTMDKVSMTSLYTIESLRTVLEQYLQTDIQFTVRIDTEKIIELADLFSPVTVIGTHAYSSGSYTFKEGEQVMNSAMMKRYMHDRNDFTSDDQYMEANPMNAIRALLAAVKPEGILDYKPLMRVLGSSVATTFSYGQLAELLQMFEMHDFHWNTQDVTIQTEAGWEYSPALTSPAYTAVPSADYTDQLRVCIQQLLNGQTPQVPAVQQPAQAEPEAQDGTDTESGS
ncbi:MAG: LCP family protein [Erysipelotrichaceae bacterium]|nr:LCP family protein [Erysipelotrichaceae bacterium]